MGNCKTCGHARCFHGVGTGIGIPAGVPYCSDRHGDDAAYNCKCKGFVLDDRVVTPRYAGSIYIIGSMRNPRVPEVAKALRGIGWDAFDDWHSPGPETDDKWQEYERARGRTFREALAGHHAKHAFALDKVHLDRCDRALLVAPAGKSAHVELGYMIGRGKPAYYLLDGEPERFDLMLQFATKIFVSVDEMLEALRG